jgi:hypothetical protein
MKMKVLKKMKEKSTGDDVMKNSKKREPNIMKGIQFLRNEDPNQLSIIIDAGQAPFNLA